MDLENKEVPALVVSEAAPESEHLSERVITGGLPVTEETATIEEEVVEEPVARSAAWIADDTEERRVGYLINAELRSDGDGSTLVGYAAMFDSPSEDLGGFTERIAPGAFKRTLGMDADVRLLFDHEGLPLARSKSGTLSLEEDNLGLKVEAALDPNSPVARSVISAVQRGDIDQMSFAFARSPILGTRTVRFARSKRYNSST
jgi:HK97 family phage prohead protease